MRRPLIGLIALALMLTGCVPSPGGEPAAEPATTSADPSPGVGSGSGSTADAFAVGTSEHTIAVGGVDRTYRVTIPPGLGRRPDLVVMLHGGFGSAQQAEQSYGWDDVAVERALVVAYPDGLGRSWNAGGCCGRSSAQAVDDVAFLEAMTAELVAALDIDRGRVFATGMSNGAMMAYRWACDTGTPRAIAPVAGTVVGDCVDPSPASVLHVHGEDDTTVRMDGAPGDGRVEVDGMAVADAVALWREADECAPPERTVAGPVTTVTATCADDRRVELVIVAAAGHQWPGSGSGGAREGLGADPPSDALDATSVIADFFAAT
jgi:polyhydroxybutyrate depolymerase